jgi:hypothetical protein
MKFWSIITLFVFINFTVLPGISSVFDWDLPQSNMIVNEEETHTQTLVVYEKTIPKTMNVHEFIKFFLTDNDKRSILPYNDGPSLSPDLSIDSPPPKA